MQTKLYDVIWVDQGWGAVSDLSLISDLSQKFKHVLCGVKSKLKLSQKQHLTPGQYQGWCHYPLYHQVFNSHGILHIVAET